MMTHAQQRARVKRRKRLVARVLRDLAALKELGYPFWLIEGWWR